MLLGVSGHGHPFRHVLPRPLAAGEDELGVGVAAQQLDAPVDAAGQQRGHLGAVQTAAQHHDVVQLPTLPEMYQVEQGG